MALQAESLLRDLANVWVTLGKEQETSGGVLRACAMTLVGLVEENAHTADVTGPLSEIMQDHPSRAVVVRVSKERTGLDANASAFCWKPFGRRQQICCEQIEIRTSAASLRDVPGVLRGLMVPDLPIVLWVRSAALLGSPSIEPFLDLADKVIVESRGYPEWRRLMKQMAELTQSGRAAADLAWTRITRWRELLAQIFECGDLGARARAIRQIVVRHSSPEPGPAAHYLAAWVRLSTGGAPEIHFEQAGETKTWQIQELRLSGDSIHVAIRRAERSVVEIQANSLSTCSVFRQLKEADLLREELSIPGQDPTFARVLASL